MPSRCCMLVETGGKERELRLDEGCVETGGKERELRLDEGCVETGKTDVM